MKNSQWLTLVGIGVTLWAIYITQRDTAILESPLQRSRGWAGSGVDPFGASYTVEKQAAGGGL